jgi:hypothetical protein
MTKKGVARSRKSCYRLATCHSSPVTRTAGKPKLRVPHMKFNRQIGDYAGEFYSIEGNPLNEVEFQAHITQVLPGPADQTRRVAKRRYV